MGRRMRYLRHFSAQAALKPYSEVPVFGGGRLMPGIGSLAKLKNLKDSSGEKIREFDNFRQMKQTYMDCKKDNASIVKFGFPGIGKGMAGEILMIFRPDHFDAVLAHQPSYPMGGIEGQWPSITAWKTHKWKTVGFWGRGDDWRRYRTQMQKGIVGPKDARRSIPNILESVKLAIPGCRDGGDFHQFLIRSSFDMISSVLMGHMTQTADKSTPYDPKDMKFMSDVLKFTELVFPMIASPKEILTHHLGITSAKQKTMNEALKESMERGFEIIDQTLMKAEEGHLNDLQRNSYLIQAWERAEGGGIDRQEFSELVALLLVAGVDTTSGFIYNTCFLLANNPDKQEKCYQEIAAALPNGASVSQDMNFRRSFPYLAACIRETQRMCPAVTGLIKTPDADIEIDGYNIPKDTMVFLNSAGLLFDEDLVEDPETFKPERWLPEAVEARKGTPSEVIDHRVIASPFSTGARMCPGSRVANLEMVIFFTEFLRKYQMRLKTRVDKIETQIGLITTPYPKPEFQIQERVMVQAN